jgi:hypothetical protein
MNAKVVEVPQWWSVPQAIVWIVTHDDSEVAAAVGIRFPSEIERLTLRPFSGGDEPPIPSPRRAEGEFLSAIQRGTVEVRGRDCGEGKSVRVVLSHMAEPRLRYHDGGICIIDDFGARSHHYWSELAIRPGECMKRWPGAAEVDEAPAVTGEGAVPPRRAYGVKASQAEHDDWYKQYRDECLAAGKSPNSKEDEAMAREALQARFDREKVRNSRSRLAPEEWGSTGKRKGKG